MTGNTCQVYLDMVRRREYAGDRILLSDVAHAAQVILEECLTPRILAPAAEGWMNTRRHGLINVKIERAQPPFVRAKANTMFFDVAFPGGIP